MSPKSIHHVLVKQWLMILCLLFSGKAVGLPPTFLSQSKGGGVIQVSELMFILRRVGLHKSYSGYTKAISPHHHRTVTFKRLQVVTRALDIVGLIESTKMYPYRRAYENNNKFWA